MKLSKLLTCLLFFLLLFAVSGPVQKAHANLTATLSIPGGDSSHPVSICEGTPIAVTISGNLPPDTQHMWASDTNGFKQETTYSYTIYVPHVPGLNSEIIMTDSPPETLGTWYYNVTDCSSLPATITSVTPQPLVSGQFVTIDFNIDQLIGDNSSAEVTLGTYYCNTVTGTKSRVRSGYDYEVTCLADPLLGKGTNTATILITAQSANGKARISKDFPVHYPAPQCAGGTPKANQMNIFYHASADPKGGCWTLELNDQNQGEYPAVHYPTDQFTFLPPDTVTSVIVGSGIQATLYHDDNFGGAQLHLNPGEFEAQLGIFCITHDPVSNACIENWNDKVSSIKLEPPDTIAPTQPPPPTNPPTPLPSLTNLPPDKPCPGT